MSRSYDETYFKEDIKALGPSKAHLVLSYFDDKTISALIKKSGLDMVKYEIFPKLFQRIWIERTRKWFGILNVFRYVANPNPNLRRKDLEDEDEDYDYDEDEDKGGVDGWDYGYYQPMLMAYTRCTDVACTHLTKCMMGDGNFICDFDCNRYDNLNKRDDRSRKRMSERFGKNKKYEYNVNILFDELSICACCREKFIPDLNFALGIKYCHYCCRHTM